MIARVKRPKFHRKTSARHAEFLAGNIHDRPLDGAKLFDLRMRLPKLVFEPFDFVRAAIRDFEPVVFRSQSFNFALLRRDLFLGFLQ